MNQEKIGELIKKIRKDNNLTQNEFAKKYNVTYQAVSKWENGKNLPDVTLIKQICKDYNIDIKELLDGNLKKSKKNYLILITISVIALLSIIIFIIFHDDNFQFKTLTSGCDNFKISGSISYNNKKSSIYISNVNYCGGNDTKEYKKIECGLYEKHEDTEKLISTNNYNDKEFIKLENYLSKLVFTIEDYDRTCKEYSNESLFLRIRATDKNNETIMYEIPLSLNAC